MLNDLSKLTEAVTNHVDPLEQVWITCSNCGMPQPTQAYCGSCGAEL